MRIFADKDEYRVVLTASEMCLSCVGPQEKLVQLSEELKVWGITYAPWEEDDQKMLFSIPAAFDYCEVRKARLRDRALVGLLGKLAQFKPNQRKGNSWGDGFASVSR